MSRDPSIRPFSQYQPSPHHLPRSLLCAEDKTVSEEGTDPGFADDKTQWERQAKHKTFSSCGKYYKRIKQHVKTGNQNQAHGAFYLGGGSGHTSLRR